jgi:hypothetical protein
VLSLFGIKAKALDIKPFETGSGNAVRAGPRRKTPGLATLRESRVNAAKEQFVFRFKISYALLWSETAQYLRPSGGALPGRLQWGVFRIA